MPNLSDLIASLTPAPTTVAEARAALNARSLEVPVVETVSPAETVLGKGAEATPEQVAEAFTKWRKLQFVRDWQQKVASLHGPVTAAAQKAGADDATVKTAIDAAMGGGK